MAETRWQDSVGSIMAMGMLLTRKRAEMSHKEFITYANGEHLIDLSTTNKLKTIVSNPILANPENYAKLPRQWGTLYELSFLPDEKLTEVIADGSVMRMKKFDIWALRGKDRQSLARRSRPQAHPRKHSTQYRSGYIKIPEGILLTDYIKSGLAMEAAGLDTVTVAAKLNIGTSSYRLIRHVVVLSQRTDLSPGDRATVDAALVYANEVQAVRPVYDAVRPILDKIWGTGTGIPQVRDAGAEERRTAAFDKAIVVLCDVCNNAPTVHVPYLGKDQAASAISKLLEARASILKLAKQIRRQRA